MPRPDLSYLKAATIVVREHRGVRLVLVGCGGTGSFVARSVAQVARVLMDMGREVRVTFVDPDTVEPANVPRTNFCDAEIGMPKAEALGRRYAAGWGIEIEVIVRAFGPKMVDDGLRHDWITILIGCVDNAAARVALDACMDRGRSFTTRRASSPGVWWLDGGNARCTGQVLLGSTKTNRQGTFPAPAVCTDVPAPSVQCPDLLEARAEERDGASLSCAELLALNAQSLSVNQRVSAEISDYLSRLLVSRDLHRVATFFDLASGAAKSTYCARPT